MQDAILTMTTEEAERILKRTSADTLESILITYKTLILKTKKGRIMKNLTDAKKILCRLKIIGEMQENKFFELKGKIPFGEEGTCSDCKGLGELYRFEYYTEEIPCTVCSKKEPGYIITACNACNNGIYKPGIPCKRCSGTGEFKKKCLSCHGGKYQKRVYMPAIKSTTHCRKCHGRGFIGFEGTRLPEVHQAKTAHVVSLDNPVIPADMEMSISSLIKNENLTTLPLQSSADVASL